MSFDAATVAAGPWLNADEAWGYMRLTSRKALYHLVRRGQIPAHRLGKRRLRFNRTELDHFLAAAPAFRR
jgi:excisionase family DNA binding protein